MTRPDTLAEQDETYACEDCLRVIPEPNAEAFEDFGVTCCEACAEHRFFREYRDSYESRGDRLYSERWG